jgi:hypothetical protein
MRKFTMVGTEQTGKYVGVATSRAQVGFRDLGNGTFRVRVEPVDGEREALTPSFQGWKTGVGGNEFRFSKVVSGEAELKATVEHALKAVGAKGRVAASEGCPDWVMTAAKEVVFEKGTTPEQSGAISAFLDAATVETEAQERKRLVAAVQAKKLPGANLASRWSLATLRAKVA